MEQYINKAALVSEIMNCIDRCNIKKKYCPANTQVEAICDNKICAYKELLSIIDTFEVKEVNLKKELDKEWNKCEPIDEGMGLETASIEHEQFDNISKHFFELGLKTKGE